MNNVTKNRREGVNTNVAQVIQQTLKSTMFRNETITTSFTREDQTTSDDDVTLNDEDEDLNPSSDADLNPQIHLISDAFENVSGSTFRGALLCQYSSSRLT